MLPVRIYFKEKWNSEIRASFIFLNETHGIVFEELLAVVGRYLRILWGISALRAPGFGEPQAGPAASCLSSEQRSEGVGDGEKESSSHAEFPGLEKPWKMSLKAFLSFDSVWDEKSLSYGSSGQSNTCDKKWATSFCSFVFTDWKLWSEMQLLPLWNLPSPCGSGSCWL